MEKPATVRKIRHPIMIGILICLIGFTGFCLSTDVTRSDLAIPNSPPVDLQSLGRLGVVGASIDPCGETMTLESNNFFGAARIASRLRAQHKDVVLITTAQLIAMDRADQAALEKSGHAFQFSFSDKPNDSRWVDSATKKDCGRAMDDKDLKQPYPALVHALAQLHVDALLVLSAMSDENPSNFNYMGGPSPQATSSAQIDGRLIMADGHQSWTGSALAEGQFHYGGDSLIAIFTRLTPSSSAVYKAAEKYFIDSFVKTETASH